MALLLRMGGVPARVASGFTAGSADSSGHPWTVSDIDAHAWVEVWFPHYGWVRFDPTPTQRARPAAGASAAPVRQDPRAGPPAFGNRSAPRQERGLRATGSAAPPRVRRGSSLVLFIAIAAVLVLAGLGLFVRSLLRPEPTDDELVPSSSGRCRAPGGRSPTGSRSPRSSTASAARRTPPPTSAHLRLSRYAGGDGRPTAAQRRALRQQLRYGLGVSGRLRSLWALPPRLRLGRGRPRGS